MMHDCGIWLMDLASFGWLYDRAIWENAAVLRAEYEKKIAAGPAFPRFDTVFVIDEKAESALGQPSFCGISGNLISAFRYEAYRAGISFAFAEITDVENGAFNDAKLYIILNPYRLSMRRCESLAAQLQKNGKTSVYMYGFGTSGSPELLTGMDVTPAEAGSTALKVTDDGAKNRFISSKTGNTVTHRYTVSGYDTLFAEYEDGLPAFALKKHRDHLMVFYGGTFLPRENIRSFCRLAGCHVYSEGNDMLVTDGQFLVCSASTEGIKKFNFPCTCDVFDILDGNSYKNITSLSLEMKLGETKWLSIRPYK